MTHRTPGGARPASRTFNRLLRITLGAWLSIRFRASYDAEALRTLEPPYLLVGNHTCNWDPFIMSIPVRGPVHFVASDEYFRTPLLRFAFSLVGGIPKTKNVRDTQAVRTLLALRRAGAVLGLYPEGNRNWDGVTGPLYSATAKLIRKLAVPVVAVETTGGALVQPRWARHARHGPMHLSYRLLFTADECRTLSEQTLSDRLAAALAHDDLDAVATARNTAHGTARYTGRRLAEHLERFLFQCPACGRQDTLFSGDDRLGCTVCGLTVRYGTDGRFHSVPSGARGDGDGTGDGDVDGEGVAPPFDNPRDWNRWQCALLEDSIRSARTVSGVPSGDASVLLRNQGARHQTGGRTGRLKATGTGSLALLPDRLVFHYVESGRAPLALPLSGITGLNIQYNDRVEMYFGDTLHRFSFPDADVSVWKWHQALLYAGVPGPEDSTGPAAAATARDAGTAAAPRDTITAPAPGNAGTTHAPGDTITAPAPGNTDSPAQTGGIRP